MATSTYLPHSSSSLPYSRDLITATVITQTMQVQYAIGAQICMAAKVNEVVTTALIKQATAQFMMVALLAKSAAARSFSSDTQVNTSAYQAAQTALVETTKPKTATYSEKPFIPTPTIFALFFITAKLFVTDELMKLASEQEELKHVNEEDTKLREERLGELKKELERAATDEKWSIATTVFSWMTSFLQILSGAALILTGAGAVAGALLLTGGILMLTNHLLKETGVWKKIGDLLPGDDPEKKAAIITWMQLGIGILALMISGAGAVLSGTAAIGQASQTANMFVGSVAAGAIGVCSIGQGISGYELNIKRAAIKKCDIAIEQIRAKRQDIQENMDGRLEQIKQVFAGLGDFFRILREQHSSWQAIV